MSDILEGHAPPLWTRFEREALRRRQDNERVYGRAVLYREGVEGAICPYCSWRIDAGGACRTDCSGGL
jgi:hypothetical protein